MQQINHKYPVGIQRFDTIRAEGYRYVDKTDLVWRLANGNSKSVFLSRPRRFGKTLLVSTLKAYFQGRKELFEGLAIEGLERSWESFSVIHIDLSSIKARNVQELEEQLDAVLRDQEALLGQEATYRLPGSRLSAMITRAHEQTGKEVVVLVDEYDAPMLAVMDDEATLKEVREIMRGFYAPLKSLERHLRFVFLTGITKFSQLSIFSELNNLKNISMNPAFASLCGITEEELSDQFGEDICQLGRALDMGYDETFAALKRRYDGYHFCEPSPDIYNPFSLLSAFDDQALQSSWFASGTPTYLLRTLQGAHVTLPELESCRARASEFDAPTERLVSPIPLLYQSGYLTIKAYDARSCAYTLGIPNDEVRIGLCENLLLYLGEQEGVNMLSPQYGLVDAIVGRLDKGDMDGALRAMRSFLASIPYDLGSRDEKGFQLKFYLIFRLLGIQIDSEVKTETGRVDAVVQHRGSTYVMEFKYDGSAGEALRQIDERGYLIPYEALDGRLVKVGVNFSSKEQTIEEGWIIQEAASVTPR